MIIVDRALDKLETVGKPIRVGLLGAGFQARGIVRQLLKYSRGIRLVAIANRTPTNAQKIIGEAGAASIYVENETQLLKTFSGGNIAVTDSADLLTSSDTIDVIVEVTGSFDYAARLLLKAFDHGKHVVSLNAELDGTIGSLLAKRAAANNVIYTLADGDQPGAELNLYRYVKALGLNLLVCGNIKGLHDPYRTPATQAAYAAKWGQKPHMVTSFADGTKISFEQACVANATKMQVAKRGMTGTVLPPQTPIEEVIKFFDIDLLKKNGAIVDYVVGAEPNGGVFVLAATDDPVQKHYLDLYKVGKGPLYCFYIPFHLCHFDITSSIARVFLFKDTICTPLGSPRVEVVAAAKRDLKKGETLDGVGQFKLYGLAENATQARKEDLLPIGLAEGCQLSNDIPKDQVLKFTDVVLPKNRLIVNLWHEQRNMFAVQV